MKLVFTETSTRKQVSWYPKANNPVSVLLSFTTNQRYHLYLLSDNQYLFKDKGATCMFNVSSLLKRVISQPIIILTRFRNSEMKIEIVKLLIINFYQNLGIRLYRRSFCMTCCLNGY